MNIMPSADTYEKCFHCGESITEKIEFFEGHSFCCQGCETVFKILQKQDLCEYYDLKANPGNSSPDSNRSNFEYLSDPQIEEKLLTYRDSKMASVTFQIPKMHCISCIWLLEKLYRFETGIISSRVNFPSKELSLKYDPSKTNLSSVVFLLASIGYEPHLSLASGGRKNPKHIDRKLWLQIAVAGFSFGNIMLLSVPEYFDFLNQLPQNFKQVFGFISFILSLPVLFFADQDYFRSAFGSLRKKALNLDVPLSLGMISLFVFSTYELFFNSGTGYFDSFAGLVFFLLLGKAFQQKTINSISFDRDYRSFFPLYATRVKDGRRQSLALDNLKIGDRILVQHQGLVPADGYLLKGEGLIDYSFVTGETLPESKQLGEVIFAGGRQVGKNIEVEIKKTVSTSYLTELWNSSKDIKPVETLSRLNDGAGKYFTVAVLIIALSGFLVWLPSWDNALKVFASVLIIACPCALALSAPFSFGNGLRILSGIGFYLKNSNVLEALSKVDYLIFDKTGTLTKQDTFDTKYIGKPLGNQSLRQIKSITGQSGHPLSKAIYHSIVQPEVLLKNFEEVPGKGLKAEIEKDFIMVGNWDWVGLNNNEPGVFVKKNQIILGRFSIEGSLRKNVQQIVDRLGRTYKLSICSGDSKASWKQWLDFLPKNSVVKFDCDPKEKAEEISRQKMLGRKVCMIGDGLNDGLALKTSDVGLAFTENKEGFTPASDGVVSKQAFQKLDKIFLFSKDCTNIVMLSFGISILYNLIGLFFALKGDLSPVTAAILMPISSISVVLFATGMTKIFSIIRGINIST
jgi:P-type Cu+ transporter